MKKIKFLLILLLALNGISTLYAQKTREELNDYFWGEKDIYKNVVEVPEKYTNESAVILYKLEDYDYHNFISLVKFTQYLRLRIKLQDQAAVKDFSEYEYNERFYNSNGQYEVNIIGIKVIKPNGKEIIIDVDKEAVKEDKTKKIAIPSLSIGDILDIYQYSVQTFASKYDYGFDPVERTLGSNYPIMNYKLTFSTENGFFTNFNSYNGAPPLKEVKAEKSSDRRYELVASDIPKNDFPRWFNPLVELPCYKFQVYFARTGKIEKMANAFLPENEKIIKSIVTKDDVFEYYNKKFTPSYVSLFDDVKNFLDSRKFTSNEEKVKEIYYFARHQYFTRYIEAMVVDKQNIFYPYELYGSSPIFFDNDVSFINYFMLVLKKLGINYDIIVSTPRENGPIKDLLIEENVYILIKVDTENPLYFGYFNPFSTPDLFPYSVEGTEAYALKVSDNKKVEEIESIKLPKSTFKDNLSKATVYVKISPDFEKISAERTSSIIGHNKEYEQKDKISYLEYTQEDYTRYHTTPLIDLVKNKNKKETYENKYNAFKQKLKADLKDEMKKSAESEFNFEMEDYNLELLNYGRFGKNDSLKYKENFTTNSSLLKKAGNNYTFEIGKFITSQVEIEEKEYKRENNIYMDYPRSFHYKIIFEIPNGYSISGLENLTMDVHNETGSFISYAEISGNTLIIDTKKEYYNYYEPNANWQKMVEFLDAAYQFTQKKILLKKL